MSTTAANPAPPTFCGQLLLCGCLGWGAVRLLPLAQQGSGPAACGLLATSTLAVVAAIKSLNALDRLLDRRRRHRQLAALADEQGDARLGDEQDAQRAGLLGDTGILLGRIGKRLVRYPGEAGVLVAGRPGSWKGVAFVIPNLLLAPRPTKKKFQSYIVTDFSGELYAVCQRKLRELGYRVLVIASEAERLSQELGVPIESVQHNPAAYLDPTSSHLLEDVDAFAHLLHPGMPPSKQNGNSEHFEELGRLLLVTFMQWLLHKYGEVTLPGLRRVVMSTSDEMHALLEEAIGSDAFGGALAESAASVLKLMVSSPEEFSGAVTNATRAIRLYSAGAPIGRQVSRHQFDWRQLKEEPTVVFIIVPPERLQSQAQFVNLTISASAEAIARCRSNQRVTYLLDEVGNTYIPNLTKIIGMYRKQGIQVVLVLQQLEAQLARIYGKDAAREIRTNCDVTLALSMTGLEDLKELSELIGQETAKDGSHSLRETDAGAPEVSYNGGFRGRPVLRTEAIRLLEKHQGLLLYANARPFLVNLMNYLREPSVKRLADKNPYYDPHR